MDNSDKEAIDTLRELTDNNASYWQKGFDDGYSGQPRRRPQPNANEWNLTNGGYLNGYKAGSEKRAQEGVTGG